MKVVSEINEINGGYQLILPTPFSVGPINVYIMKEDVLTLIDTGPKVKETWDAFCRLLEKINIKPTDIEQVVLTHHHPDHVGLLDYLPDVKTIIGHWKNNPWIDKNDAFYEWHDTFYMKHLLEYGVPERMLAPVIEEMKKTYAFACSNRRITNEVIDGSDVPGLPGWTVLETPGHAGSHIVLYHEQSGQMLAGDLIIENITPNPIIEPPYKGESARAKSLLQYNDSIKRCLELDISLVYSGHGNNVEDVKSYIQLNLDKQEERANRVFEYLKEKPLTAFEVSEKLYPALYKKQLGLTMSSTIGQLDYLEDQQAIKIDKTNAVWKFSAC